MSKKNNNQKKDSKNKLEQNEEEEQIESAPNLDNKDVQQEQENIEDICKNQIIENQIHNNEQIVEQTQQTDQESQIQEQHLNSSKHEQVNPQVEIQKTSDEQTKEEINENDQLQQFNDAQQQKQQDLLTDQQEQTGKTEQENQQTTKVDQLVEETQKQKQENKEPLINGTSNQQVESLKNEEFKQDNKYIKNEMICQLDEQKFQNQPQVEPENQQAIACQKPKISLKKQKIEDSDVTEKSEKQDNIVQIQQHEVVLNAQGPVIIEKTNNSVMIEGAPQIQLKKQNDDVILESVQKQKMEKKVEQTNIEIQPKMHVELHQQIELQQQPQMQQQVFEQKTETQSQVQVEIQKNLSNIITIEKSQMQTEKQNESVYLEVMPTVQLVNHQEVSIEQHPEINLESQNLDTQVEKCPQIEIPNTQQTTTLLEHPIVNLEVNQFIQQVNPSPDPQSVLTQQIHSIEQQPQSVIEQQEQFSYAIQAPQTEIQLNFNQATSEPQQKLDVEDNQQQTQIIQEEEKVHVKQLDETHIMNQPSHEVTNVEKKGVIEQKPQLYTEQNTNPVQVSHNDNVQIEGYHKQQKQVPLFAESPTQQFRDSEPLQPQNDAEQQFLNRTQSDIYPSQSKILQQVPQEVGAFGLSIAAAAGASQFIMKNGVKSKEGIFAALAGSAILYAGYRLFKSKSQQNSQKD